MLSLSHPCFPNVTTPHGHNATVAFNTMGSVEYKRFSVPGKLKRKIKKLERKLKKLRKRARSAVMNKLERELSKPVFTIPEKEIANAFRKSI